MDEISFGLDADLCWMVLALGFLLIFFSFTKSVSEVGAHEPRIRM